MLSSEENAFLRYDTCYRAHLLETMSNLCSITNQNLLNGNQKLSHDIPWAGQQIFLKQSFTRGSVYESLTTSHAKEPGEASVIWHIFVSSTVLQSPQ
jgi:hypothetical protein